MNSDSSRRRFVKLGIGSALLGSLCPLLAQSPSTNDAAPGKAENSEELVRLRNRLQSQRDGTTQLLAELRDKHGAGIVATIAAYQSERSRKNFEKRPIQGPRNLKALKDELWGKLGKDYTWELVEETPERMRFRVSKCPNAVAYQKLNAADIGYAMACATDPGIAAGINPKIVFSRTKTLMQGHDCCDHCYELKG